ncbi:transposase [Paenibacillus sp. TRM 82003]|nr:transposase [Kineococcus sp. TRM81007]MCI3920488.1 transposase [Paenibacillus sp. TRM 82003]
MLLAAGRTVSDVAESLGIAQSCLYRWRRQDLIDRGQVDGVIAQVRCEDLGGAQDEQRGVVLGVSEGLVEGASWQGVD